MNVNNFISLSICIPIYNNANIFKYSLEFLGYAIKDIENEIEIVISDNNSQDNIDEIISEFKACHPNILLNYQKNKTNMGLAYNFHRVVELATGKYCWIIGSDDFLLEEGVKKILNVIKKYPEIPFISVIFGHINLAKIIDKDNLNDPYHNVKRHLLSENSTLISKEISNIRDGIYKWDELTSPSLNNVMFGSIMAGVFLRKSWIENSINKDELPMEFNSVQTIYPHIKIYSRSMVGKKAYHISSPVIIVGDGVRPWAGDSFWDGSLPVIYLKVFNEVIDEYKKSGLDFLYIIRNRIYYAKLIGRFFVPYLRRVYIEKKHVKNQKEISLTRQYLKIWYAPTFYIAFLKGLIREVLKGERK